MLALIAAVGLGAISAGIISHIRHPEPLRELLSRATRHSTALAICVILAETVLALSALAALFSAPTSGWIGVVGWAGLVFGLAFTGWVSALFLTGSTLGCGCSFSDAALNKWSVLRSLSICSLAALIAIPADPQIDISFSAGYIAQVLAGFALGVVLYVIPEAFSWPQAAKATMKRIETYEHSGGAALGTDR